MGRKSITGGVMPAGTNQIRFDFSIDGKRFRPTLRWTPNETNLRGARTCLTRIKAQIEARTFCFADEFPRYRGLNKLPASLQSRSCGEVFDDFLRHEEARLARGDLAAATVASHRKILNHVWRPNLGAIPFWAEGAVETDIVAIRESMNRQDRTEPSTGRALPMTAIQLNRPGHRLRGPERGLRDFAVVEAARPSAGRFGSRFATSQGQSDRKSLKVSENFGGKGGLEDPGIMSPKGTGKS